MPAPFPGCLFLVLDPTPDHKTSLRACQQIRIRNSNRVAYQLVCVNLSDARVQIESDAILSGGHLTISILTCKTSLISISILEFRDRLILNCESAGVTIKRMISHLFLAAALT